MPFTDSVFPPCLPLLLNPEPRSGWSGNQLVPTSKDPSQGSWHIQSRILRKMLSLNTPCFQHSSTLKVFRKKWGVDCADEPTEGAASGRVSCLALMTLVGIYLSGPPIWNCHLCRTDPCMPSCLKGVAACTLGPILCRRTGGMWDLQPSSQGLQQLNPFRFQAQ